MSHLFDQRRYLTDFDSKRAGNILTDVLVIGSGVAGARAALEAARSQLVILVTKEGFADSTTHHAQGGIAAAVGAGDSPDQHFDDTLRAGAGLNSPEAVRRLVADGPQCIEELLRWNFEADRGPDGLALTREGGHHLQRIVHAHGDQTGQELSRTLQRQVAGCENIRLFEHCYLIDLMTVDGACVGAVTYHKRHGHQLIWAKQTVLATGGCGQLWRETTNPPMATGDGLAAAFRAGADLCDMEFMQFHPTTLYIAGAGRALISEAVRGEGGKLVDRAGHRFMTDYHPEAELAPRDVVSMAIHQHLMATKSNCVYLDVRHLPHFAQRFPQIARLCGEFQIDPTRDLIPVRPAAHYLIGGVAASLEACTSLPGLFCCGESAWNGVHGANRLASNSLLEGLVFGRIAGAQAAELAARERNAKPIRTLVNQNVRSARTHLDLPDIRNSLRSLMWRNVGIVRRQERLIETRDILDFWAHYTLDKTFDNPTGWEVQNELTVARLVAMSVLERTESIGVHCRDDASDATATPVRKPVSMSSPNLYHTVLTRDSAGTKAKRVPHRPAS